MGEPTGGAGSPGAARFVVPMLAQQGPDRSGGDVPALPGGAARWVFEPKLDGLRGLAVRNGPRLELLSRNGLSFNERFPAVVAALKALPADNFVLDGEVVGLAAGRPDFAALQQGNAISVEYWAFDLPWLLGQDLRALPIEERRALLGKVVTPGPVVKTVPVLSGDPAELLESACSQGLEGLVAKRRGSLYAEGRSPDWRKLKCASRQELVIGGYTPPQRSREFFGALLLGYWDSGAFVYAGKVGTGFTHASLRALHGQLVALGRPVSPFSTPVREKGALWVEPVLVAEIQFSNWTADGRLRHPSFLGLRPDKDASTVVREVAVPSARHPRNEAPRV